MGQQVGPEEGDGRGRGTWGRACPRASLLSAASLLPPPQTGRFLGEVDGALLSQLVSMGVFIR